MYRVLGYGTVYCTQPGESIFFQNTKVTCILLYNLGGVAIFPLKHKSAMYTPKGGGKVLKIIMSIFVSKKMVNFVLL